MRQLIVAPTKELLRDILCLADDALGSIGLGRWAPNATDFITPKGDRFEFRVLGSIDDAEKIRGVIYDGFIQAFPCDPLLIQSISIYVRPQ